jgi:hypothetical protein
MLIYAGIDEAGYGPLLGPLCLGATVFAIEHHEPSAGPPDLWKQLNRCVCRKVNDKRRRVAINDSKLLKAPNDGAAHPLRHLERGVIGMLACQRDVPSSDVELFEALEVAVPPPSWYSGQSPLPLAHTRDELGVAAARLRTGVADAGVKCLRMRCCAIDPADFNRQVSIMGTKSSVNFCAILKLADAIWRRWPDAHPRIVIDRQGGRTHYREDLQFAWPDATIQVLAETDSISRYRLHSGDSAATITFQTEAEADHLPVALASMIAKYVRELFMLRLNRFFGCQMNDLKPTAGYFKDGRRYLADIEPVIARLGLNRSDLVRVR